MQMHVQWQGMPIVEKQMADKGIQNTDDNGAKYQEQTTAICDGL
jgi:hypothetical protein